MICKNHFEFCSNVGFVFEVAFRTLFWPCLGFAAGRAVLLLLAGGLGIDIVGLFLCFLVQTAYYYSFTFMASRLLKHLSGAEDRGANAHAH